MIWELWRAEMIAVIWVRQEGRHEHGEAEKKSVIIIDCTKKMAVRTRSSPLFFFNQVFSTTKQSYQPCFIV